MNASLGRVIARLAEPEETVSLELINLINTNINPPSPVREEDVFIRAMYIVSDEVNSFGGRFPHEEYDQLCQLLVDSPVMIGHRKDKLPIGRNFHATIVNKDNRQWVKSYFYWLKNATGAETLRENIDGGIYKECSIGFSFHFPECSICGKDIRLCEHEPLKTYRKGNGEESCYFNYRQIERVLETSLVYRGAVPDTEISKDLYKKNASASIKTKPSSDVVITSPLELDAGKRYLLTPYYDGLPIVLSFQNDQLNITTSDSHKLSDEIIARFATKSLPECENVFGYLIGLRGKERCSVGEVQRFLIGESSPVTRLEVRLLPQNGVRFDNPAYVKGEYSVRIIRHCYSDVIGVPQASRAIMTRDGVRIWAADEPFIATTTYCYRPSQDIHTTDRYYSLRFIPGTGPGWLSLVTGDTIERFAIRQFNIARLKKGGRFIADKLSVEPTNDNSYSSAMSGNGRIKDIKQHDGGYRLTLTGTLNGTYVLKPVKLDEKERYLFYVLL